MRGFSPENIFFTENFKTIKLGDYEFFKGPKLEGVSNNGIPAYMSPENFIPEKEGIERDG